MKTYFVYIMASFRRVFYTGTTSKLEKRVWQHKNNVDPESFCSRYRVHRLVYFEKYDSPISAINREKKVKRLSRAEKVALIESMNPKWRGLSEGWGKPMRPSELKIMIKTL